MSSIPKKQQTENGIIVRKEHRVKPLPKPTSTEKKSLPDTVTQKKATAAFQANLLAPFEGIGKKNYPIGSDPPDTNGAVGLTQYVEWVNTAFAVYDKNTGTLIGDVLDGNSLFSGFGGDCQQFNDGDPIVLYDKAADRWVLSQFAVTGGENTPGGTFSHCIAVSQTPDARGKYNRYEFKFNDFNDYPKLGVWPDAYYVTFNMFHANSFTGSKACAYDRTKMLAGQAATMQCFDVPNQGGLLPADLDGPKNLPVGSSNFFLNFNMNGASLNLWKFHADWADTTKTTFTGPQAIPVSAFTIGCDPCVAQPKGGIQLGTLSDRLMFRLAYRKFADHDSLVVNHTVSAQGVTGIRWYEIRNPGGTPTIAQQSTFSPDKNFRWMGSIAMDKMGNAVLGYSVSSSKVFPAVRFTSRNFSDPAGVMSAEKIVQPGVGVQNDPDRWGDYSSMTLDPVDDCTFYFSTQFAGETGKGSYNWHTLITKMKFPSCQ